MKNKSKADNTTIQKGEPEYNRKRSKSYYQTKRIIWFERVIGLVTQSFVKMI